VSCLASYSSPLRAGRWHQSGRRPLAESQNVSNQCRSRGRRHAKRVVTKTRVYREGDEQRELHTACMLRIKCGSTEALLKWIGRVHMPIKTPTEYKCKIPLYSPLFLLYSTGQKLENTSPIFPVFIEM